MELSAFWQSLEEVIPPSNSKPMNLADFRGNCSECMSQIGLTESVRGDTKRFEVWL
ncbi:hypothetical protein DOY81_009752, partial [Sarcophaga bullata]